MSVRMQKLQLASNSVMLPSGVIRPIFAGAPVNSVPSVNQTVAVGTVGDGPRLAVGRWHLELLQRPDRGGQCRASQ